MQRYFVRFPQETMRMEAHAMLATDAERFQPFFPLGSRDSHHVLIADLSDEERKAAERNGAEVFEDVQFYPVANPFEFRAPDWEYWKPPVGAMPMLAPWQSKSLTDVLDHIHAPAAWQRAKGRGVTIGIVDTGVAASMPEFPANRRSPYSKSFSSTSAWVDTQGHGSMCASIAAGSDSNGGRYNGVAPEATIMSLRTTFASTDIYKLYDWVLMNRNSGSLSGPVVMSNSYGMYTCAAPIALPANHPYLQIVRDLVTNGVTVVFAAGNNHYTVLCNHDPAQCSPNTIWGVNSIDDVISVGTINWDDVNDTGVHANSSRGPGQWAVATQKPDCVAPTYGEVVWGNGYQKMEWWGTSGACPQVAGLAALLLEIDPGLKPAEVAQAILSNCDSLTGPSKCVGAGRINCEKTVNSLP